MGIAKRLFDTYRSDDVEPFLKALAEVSRPDAVWREDPGWPGAGVYRGIDEIRGLFEDRLESSQFDSSLEQLLEAGDKVVALFRWHVRGRGSGAEAEAEVAAVLTFLEGKVAEIEFFLDRARAIKAAGLRSDVAEAS